MVRFGHGMSLKARKYRLKVKEIKMKVVLYNLSRLMSFLALLVLVRDFYKARPGMFIIWHYYDILSVP